jgi:fumarate hydratase class II
MVCAQIIGNDTTISFGATQGHFQLNVFKPVMASNLIESCKLLSDACNSFNKKCLKGIKANKKVIEEKLNNSLMLVTALNTKIGYYKAAEIANKAHKNGTTLKEEAVKLGYLSSEQYDEWVKPENMI